MTHNILTAVGVALALAIPASPTQAEVLKFMRICPEQKLCPYFELVLKPPQDWVEDKEASKQNGVQIMLPRGRTFGNAPALMYVKISSRQDGQTVEDFVRNSQERWRKSVTDTKIEKIAEVQRANGRPAFLSYRYENPSRPQQRFEAVSFGIDSDKDGNDFFVMVAVTGKDKKAIDQAMTRYNTFLKAH